MLKLYTAIRVARRKYKSYRIATAAALMAA